MSLYNLLFGFNSAAPVLLHMLGTNAGAIPRFRDCFVDGDSIVIHTRTGGGNRVSYEEGNEYLTTLPGYIRDADDDFDCTYANFYYSFPVEYADELRALSADNPAVTPSEKWAKLLESMKTP